MGAQQLEQVVAAVVDDAVGRLPGRQVGQRREALVAVRGEVEVDRQPGLQVEQAAKQALWVIGLRVVGLRAGLLGAAHDRPIALMLCFAAHNSATAGRLDCFWASAEFCDESVVVGVRSDPNPCDLRRPTAKYPWATRTE